MRLLITGLIICSFHGVAMGQALGYPADILQQLRDGAKALPGDLPIEVRVSTLNPMRGPLSTMVEGAAGDTVTGGYPVFQIRYSEHWIAVDAGLDQSFVPTSTTFSAGTYDSIQTLLRDARLVILTHEHHDHVAGLLSSRYFTEIRSHTLLTPAQVATLRDRPNRERIRIDSATAASFRTVDYELLKPIWPGVVLLRAPGHSPGSQMIYVQMQGGRELILAGDVAWHTEGIKHLKQKPVRTSLSLQEDQAAIGAQLAWLKSLADEHLHVLVSHDEAALEELVKSGVIARAFKLR